MFPPRYLEELDQRTWEEAPALTHEQAVEHGAPHVDVEDVSERFEGYEVKKRVSHSEVRQVMIEIAWFSRILSYFYFFVSLLIQRAATMNNISGPSGQ